MTKFGTTTAAACNKRMTGDRSARRVAKEPRLTLRSLIAWLRKQSPDQTYSYTDHCGCAIAQYVISQGFRRVLVTPDNVYVGRKKYPLPVKLDLIMIKRPHAFGAALERALEARQ